MTTIVAPPGYDWREITAYIMKTYNIEISGGLGLSAGMVRSVPEEHCIYYKNEWVGKSFIFSCFTGFACGTDGM